MSQDSAPSIPFLQTVMSSVDVLRAHSSQHPRATEAFEAAWRELRRMVLTSEAFVLEQSEGVLTADGKPLQGDPTADKFATWMADRRVRRIVLRRDTTTVDFRHLLDLFLRSASEALIAGTLRPAIPQSMPSIELVAAERVEDLRGQTSGYLRGDLLQRALGLKTLEEIQQGEGVVGVSRLQILAQGKAERFVTVTYRADRAEVEIVHASRPFRDALAGELTAERFAAEVSLTGLSSIDIVSWTELRDRARKTGPCAATETLRPEVRFRHQLLYVPGLVLDVLWEDPNPADHPVAWDVVDHYLQMIEALGLPLERTPVAPPAAGPAPLGDLASAAAACAERWAGLDLAALIERPWLAHVEPADRERAAGLDAERMDQALKTWVALVLWATPV